MIRRPLFVIFLCLIVWTCIWYRAVVPDQPPQLLDEPVSCEGTVDEIQTRTSGTALVLSGVEMIQTDSNSSVFYEKILIYDFSHDKSLFHEVRHGNVVRVSGVFSVFEHAANPGEFDAFSYYESRGIGGRVSAESLAICDSRCDVFSDALYTLRQSAAEQLFARMDADDAGLLCAMILGEKAYLPEEEKELYRQTGIGHMLAISGLHISLLGAGLFFFLRRFVMPVKPAVLVTVTVLFVYGQLTGFPVATSRAVLMMCCLLFARYTGRSYDTLSALSLSGIVTLLQQPAQLFQCGFLLSYTALAGILLFAPVLESCRLAGVKKAFLSGASVFVTTMPVMLWFFYEICPYSVLTNLLVLPFLSLLTGTGMAGCVCSFFLPSVGEFILATVHYLLQFYESVCLWIRSLPVSTVVTGRPPLWFVIVYYVLLFAVVRSYVRWEKKSILYTGVAAFVFLSFFVRRKTEFLYTQLSVGQGDCACLFYGDETYLMDGGSSSRQNIGTYTIRNFLKFYGRERVNQIFISHSDADHTNGIAELAEHQGDWGIRIGGIVMPELQEPDERYRELVYQFQENKVPVIPMKKGECLVSGELRITCLHPFPGYDWKNENDYSLTLAVCYENLRILTVGDLEESGESVLSHAGPYDVLKVGHHGSQTSSSEEFLSQVSPAHGIISAGKNNRYGHPAPQTLQRLEKQGVRIWNTIDKGAVFVEWKEGEARLSGYLDSGTRKSWILTS